MRPGERRRQIIELVTLNEELAVDELAREFAASRETIRRDLAILDSQGQLRRVHGGAQKQKMSIETPFDERLVENTHCKKRIARRAGGLFEKNDAIFVDTGSTTEFFAEELAKSGSYTIITNSINVAVRINGGAGASRVYLIGGEFHGEAREMLGSVALEQIARFHADHAVLTVGAINADQGFMDYELEEAMVARAMIAQAQSVTVIADHTKFGRVALAKVCDLQAVNRLVTDEPPPQVLGERLQSAGIEVLVTSE